MTRVPIDSSDVITRHNNAFGIGVAAAQDGYCAPLITEELIREALA